ncbi:MAG: NAD(P)H-dependent oxidoreductase [Aeromicrobium sp.]|nr:NAD(P)H-dependent oxidoreductase [Burkholderiales bacterium]
MAKPNIVAFAGSNRQGSMNRAALALAVSGAREAGAEVNVVDLREFEMPLYDADFHTSHGVPDSVRQLRELMRGANGLLIASPEYNASITPLLKNTIDWLSQSVSDGIGAGGGRMPFDGKIVGLLGASAGAFGTIRALPHVSYILSNLGAIVLPVVAVPGADKLFTPDGAIANDRQAKMLHSLGAKVSSMANVVVGGV